MPYFDTNHAAGALLFMVVLAWGALELAQYSKGQEGRRGATRIGPRSGIAATPRGTGVSSRWSGDRPGAPTVR